MENNNIDKETKIKALENAGIDEEDQSGFEVETMSGYFDRERTENALEAGEFVPESKIPEALCQEAKDIYRRQRNLEFIEALRTWRESEDRDKPIDPIVASMETPDERFKRQQGIFERYED